MLYLRNHFRTFVSLLILLVLATHLVPAKGFALPEDRELVFPYYSDKKSACDATGSSSGSTTLPEAVPQVWRDLINAAAPKYPDVDPRLVATVLWIENKGWPEYKADGWAQSNMGARGPFQFIAGTWFGNWNLSGWPDVKDESNYAPNALGTDGDGDGVRDPTNPKDAVEAAFKHHKGSMGKPIADEGFTGNAEKDFETVVFHRRDTNLLYYAAKYNGSGAPDNTPLKNFPRGENANYVITAYWLLASNFEKGWDYGGTHQPVDAATFGNKAGDGTVSSGSLAAADTSGSCSSSGSASGQVVGDVGWPLEVKWWNEHKDWFLKPHHDYPAADIPVPDGTPVFAVLGGKIIAAPNEGGYGRGVTIQSGEITMYYGHGKDGGEIDGAHQGDTVKAGQLIMHSSYTGSVSPPGPGGAHLHFEIRIGGQKYCPQPLFQSLADNAPIKDLTTLPTSGCSN